MRRLDPWAAIVLGGLLAMGVVILLATPGPWQKVVHTQPPVRLEAPAPDDVAVFVMGGRGGACTGVLWLHVDAARNALAAVVVAPRVSGFSPTDGYAPIAAIADSAGPGAAAQALGGALGVSMDAWVALDRAASDLAIQAMFPASEPRTARTRYREARSAWRGRGGDATAWATQYASLRVALPQVSFDELGVVAFSNYVLGFGFVRSDLTLQGATSLAEALRDVDPGLVDVRAAPVVVERSRGGEVWHADASRVEPLRQSLAMGMRPPETDKLVTVRIARRARPRGRAALPRARRPVRRGSAPPARPVGWERDRGDPRERGRRSAGVPCRSRARPRGRRWPCWSRRPSRVTPPPPRPSPRCAPCCATAGRRRSSPDRCPPARTRVDRDGHERRPGDCRRGRPPAGLVAPGAAAAGALPAGAGRRALVAAARANVETLVRACWPGTLAPDLSSTRLDFAFIAARHTGVGVLGASDSAVAGVLASLRLWGFSGVRLTLESGGWQPPQTGPAVFYRPGAKDAALALAGDLGLAPRSVVRADDSPQETVISLGD